MGNLSNIGFKILNLVTLGICGMLMNSCHQDIPATTTNIKVESSFQFMASLDENLDDFMDAPIVVNSIDESEPSSNPQKELIGSKKIALATPVYVDLSCVESPVYLSKISTPRQIMSFVRTSGAEISMTKEEGFNHTLLISDVECSIALKKFITDSKRHLYAKGFTDIEIQDMLIENDVDDSALVPFVITLSEEEEYQRKNAVIVPLSYNFRTDIDVDWDRAGGCALKALGADVLVGFAQSSAKTWSKAVLKKLFKTVASKALGPVGVSVAVIEFSLCYWG